MVFKSGFRWFMFVVTTIVCGGCGVWIYLWTQNGWLYEIGAKAFFLRLTILILPFLMSALLTYLYDGRAGELEIGTLSFVLCIVIPLIGAVIARNGLFGLDAKLCHILQIAIPLGLTYLMCLQCIICPEEPVRSPYTPPKNPYEDMYVSSTPHDPNDDCNSKGLPTGLAD